jgi:hypothetical protein
MYNIRIVFTHSYSIKSKKICRITIIAKENQKPRCKHTRYDPKQFFNFDAEHRGIKPLEIKGGFQILLISFYFYSL